MHQPPGGYTKLKDVSYSSRLKATAGAQQLIICIIWCVPNHLVSKVSCIIPLEATLIYGSCV